MNKESFPGLPPVLGCHHILFQALSVVSKKVYIPPATVALFYNANVMVKAPTLLFTHISTDSSLTAKSSVLTDIPAPELAETLQ